MLTPFLRLRCISERQETKDSGKLSTKLDTFNPPGQGNRGANLIRRLINSTFILKGIITHIKWRLF